MALSFSVFLVLYNLSIVLAVGAGTAIFVNIKERKLAKVLASARRNLPIIIILAVIPVFVLTEKWFAPAYANLDYTPLIYSFFGEFPADVQRSLLNPMMTAFMDFVYVYGFTFIIYFTPYILIVNSGDRILRKYAAVIVINYIVLIPFYIFFPVHTPAYSEALTTVSPILYNNQYLGRMVTGIDPLDNCFPSGHISLMLSTLFVMWKAKGEDGETYGRYAYFVLLSFILISISILYLGIHWPADIAGGIILAYAAYYVVEKGHVFRLIDAFMRFFKNGRKSED